MATSVLTKPAAKGGSFLLEAPAPADIFTPADLSDDQKLIGQTAEEFVVKEVLPFAKDLDLPSLNTIAPMSLDLTDATGSGSDIVRVAVRRMEAET